ncbi:MAG: histidinol dehydrogenase [Rhodospirillaceae bacterium]|nr:histidinol dehydrogenase [Rhodospirillaceae bacterium]MCY4237000.1 histidinol dehydrogenase [Rhodospirillaceae bacterium]
MPARRLERSESGFDEAFDALLNAKRSAEANVDAVVADILSSVRTRGDEALAEYTRRFDRLDLERHPINIPAAQIAEARRQVLPEQQRALEHAAQRIRAYHERQRPEDWQFEDSAGFVLGSRWTPVDSAGLYVPGGTAAYPSSLLMNAIPARVAGVGRLVMVVPTPNGEINDLVLAAANIAGVEEIYRIGGAQAIGALAYGTESIRPVDKIVGPGNAYVASAKKQVFGLVGIDMLAGPSEILVIADNQSDPTWIAADLLSQAEHDPTAQSILITDSTEFADRVVRAVEDFLATLPRAAIARESWETFGAVITVDNLERAVDLVDRIAPEHLELAMDQADAFAARVRHAGAIFIGRHVPEAVGDYIGGPNHVLPTSRAARFSSGLGVLDFMKRTSTIQGSAEALGAVGPDAMVLARAEGLDAHALSIGIRLGRR